MATIVKMPKTGLNMTEGVIISFMVGEGDAVEAEQPLAEIETDKNTTEITAPEAGTVLKIFCEAGDTLPILTPVMAIGKPGETIEAEEGKAPDRAAAPAVPAAHAAAAGAAAAQAACSAGGRIKASPLARRIAQENNILLSSVNGSGPAGEIMRRDVLAYLEQAGAAKQAAPAAAAIQQPPAWDLPVRERIPFKGMRRSIAQNMSMSKTLIPHAYQTISVNMSSAMLLRRQLSESGIKVSYNDIITKAVCAAVKTTPMINASMGDGEILLFDTVNVGIAVSVEDGLVVPVIHGADKKTLTEVAECSGELIRAAREGKLAPDARTGGTITISNLGMYRIDRFSAIINPPESCILAVARIEERPVALNGSLCIQPMMDITASFDHRIIDGAVGAKFLTELKRLIENPALALV